MIFLFCSDFNDPSIPESMFQKQVDICYKLYDVYYLDTFDIFTGKFDTMLRRIKNSDIEQEVIYRGWFLNPNQYINLYKKLEDKNYKLINTYDQYIACHYLPNWYNYIEEYTAKSVISVGEPCFDDIHKRLETFGNSPLIIKDFVSSRKHSWKDCCFIESASNKKEVERVVNNFVKLQIEDKIFTGGVIFREFLQLKSIGFHPKSGMPISKEFRTFVYNGKIISTEKYWDCGHYDVDLPSKIFLKKVAKIIYTATGNRFFTIDSAQLETGEWICIEIGDGQISEIPDDVNLDKFYKNF